LGVRLHFIVLRMTNTDNLETGTVELGYVRQIFYL